MKKQEMSVLAFAALTMSSAAALAGSYGYQGAPSSAYPAPAAPYGSYQQPARPAMPPGYGAYPQPYMRGIPMQRPMYGAPYPAQGGAMYPGYPPAYPQGRPQMNPQTSASAAATAAPEATDAAVVTIQQMRFNPPQVVIKQGGTVTWNQADRMPHDVTASDGSYASDRLRQGGMFNQTFDKPGTYDYYCSLHPNMRGQVVVVE